MKHKALNVLFVLLLLSLPMSAPGEASGALDSCPAVPAQSEGVVVPLLEETAPVPELDLLTPKPQKRGCYMDCVIEWEATMCAGLSGTEHQQCVNDGAEGCRCGCGMYCP